MAEENLQITTFEQLATLLSQVAQNNTNLSLTYYNMFYNSTPQDITLSLYVDGTLQSFTVPNRAKDFNYIKNGSGSPEGSVIASIGTTYQDTLNGKLYIKVTGTDSQGWVEIANNEMLQYGVNNPEGVITAPSGALYVNTSTAILYIKTTSTGSTGWTSISNSATTWAKIDLSNISVGSSDIAGNKIRSAILGGASTIAGTDLTANKALVSNGSGKVSVSDTTATELAAIHGLTATASELNKLSGLVTTKTELGYVNGVTSGIQTQINSVSSQLSGKQATLVSGTNIKTINSNSILGQGNIAISGNNLFDFKWSDHSLNDQSWLRADTFSWQNGTTYATAYAHLVADISGKSLTSETVGGVTIQYYLATDGHKICPASQESNITSLYNSTGVAWYYILDTTNTRFKLPRTKYGFNGYRDGVGNYIPETLPDHTHYASSRQKYSDGSSNYANWAGTTNDTQTGTVKNNSTYQDGAPVQERATQMYLYFYVGEFSQTATEQTAGLNAELFNGKLDVTSAQAQAPYLKTCYVNGTRGYNIWSNGYCEQWGFSTQSSSSGNVTISLLKEFNSANYIVMTNDYQSSIGSGSSSILSKTSSTFVFAWTSKGLTGFDWKASGYLAEGEY